MSHTSLITIIIITITTSPNFSDSLDQSTIAFHDGSSDSDH